MDPVAVMKVAAEVIGDQAPSTKHHSNLLGSRAETNKQEGDRREEARPGPQTNMRAPLLSTPQPEHPAIFARHVGRRFPGFLTPKRTAESNLRNKRCGSKRWTRRRSRAATVDPFAVILSLSTSAQRRIRGREQFRHRSPEPADRAQDDEKNQGQHDRVLGRRRTTLVFQEPLRSVKDVLHVASFRDMRIASAACQ